MKISIIIPIYKVELFLDQCVKSVIDQSYKDIEVILVDDGSPDKCPQMCDAYATSNQGIKVVHKQNGGLSDARNAGIKVATGDYIIFIDSDDYWLDTNLLSALVEEVKIQPLVDIVLFGRMDYFEDTQQYIQGGLFDCTRINNCTKNDVFQYLLQNKLFEMSACFLIIRRALLIENNIYFEKGLLGEDTDWSLKLWLHVNSVRAINNFAYCYRHRSASITSSYTILNFSDFVYVIKKWMQYAETEMTDKILARLYLGYLAYLYPTLLRNYYLISKKDRNEEYLVLKSLLPILSYSSNSKTSQVITLKRYLGFRLTCIVFGLFGLVRKKGYRGLRLLWK